MPEHDATEMLPGDIISELYAALIAAEAELRLIRMKDTSVVYNPVLSTQIALALSHARGETND